MSKTRWHMNRRDFLSHGMRAGVGLAASGTALGALTTSRVSAAQTTLTYISVSNLPGVKEAMAKQFEQANAGVKVNVVYGPSTEDQYHDKMVTLLAAKDSSIDVFDTDVIWPPEMALPGWMAPLDAYLSPALRKKYSPSMIDAQTFNGHLVGIPYYMDSGHLIYRKDLLDAHGFQAPKTWAELAHQAQVITKANKGLYGYVADWSKNEQLSDNFFEFIWSNGGDLLDSHGKVVINSPQNVEAVQMMKDFITKYQIMAPGVLSIGLEPGRTLFTEGHAVFHRNWGYAYGLSENAAAGSKIVGKADVTTLPGFHAGSGTGCTGGWSYSVNAFGKNIAIASKFAQFMGSPKLETYEALHGQDPAAYLPALTDPQVAAKYPAYPKYVPAYASARSRPKTPFYNQISTMVQINVGAALAGSASPKDALDQAARQIQRVVSRSH
jgi:ABC-type glycerol-3-phosphate transport system substrate-binding protein